MHLSSNPPAPGPDASTGAARKRPSTAPSAELKLPLLPSAKPPVFAASSSSSLSLPVNTPGSSDSGPSSSIWSSNYERTFSDTVSSSDAATDRSSLLPPSYSLSPPLSLREPENPSYSLSEDAQYDWNLFVPAYAAGQWDPSQIPIPPNPTVAATVMLTASQSENSSPQNDLVTRPGFLRRAMTSSSSGGTVTLQSDPSIVSWTRTNSELSSLSIPDPSDSHSPKPAELVTTTPSLRPTLGSHISLSQRRNHNLHLATDSSSRLSRRDSIASEPHHSPLNSPTQFPASTSSNPTAVAVAATLRWASSGVSVRPLALPSPERELIDPMASAVTQSTSSAVLSPPLDPQSKAVRQMAPLRRVIPNNPTTHLKQEHVKTPPKLGTIPGSPEERLDGAIEPRASELGPSASASVTGTVSPQPRPPPATAPFLNTVMQTSQGDYFSPLTRASMVLSVMGTSPAPMSSAHSPSASNNSPQVDLGSVKSPEASPCPLASMDSCSLMDLNRQSSEPVTISMVPDILPNSTDRSESGQGGARSQNDSPPFPAQIRPADGVKHPVQEDFYCDHGWLAAPLASTETERLKALYKFNLMHTHKDVNFDRITHLAKLVFQAKSVAISLVDTRQQWFKSEAGWNLERTSRVESLCSHTILQRSDEPVVILDTLKDWRFAKSPLVTGSPHIRFYAGAPLRTQDGFNIGTLCLLDDHPWSEFTPRSRHALKEFASIIIREMELWKDKIQLKIRDRIQLSMEQFTRECLHIDSGSDDEPTTRPGAMERIYERAAHLVKSTLDVEGACVIDVSRSGLHESSQDSEGQISVTLYGTFNLSGTTTTIDSRAHYLSSEDYEQIVTFFNKHPDGVVTETRLPPWFSRLLPPDILHALIVPIFNIDQRPFALLVAYNTTAVSKNFLDGHELSYLRAVGVIILSAVLKRRMILADKAKSLFISNISHELRTPLHGILAAAELLAESSLNHHQQSFLQTVQACGASLVETVNHVLDYTKLSGNVRAGGLENVIPPSEVDLMQLVEDAVEGCWVGFKARMPANPTTEIGSVYAPPNSRVNNPVETVVDVELRKVGWHLMCEKGGIRRILMNLIGNSLKFTSSGYIHVALRAVVPLSTISDSSIRIELSVNDTGKGINGDFLRTQLFEPFSQENPLQTGTGLGLAIVKSIVESKGIHGNLDVSSIEGVGTEMRISFNAEALPSSRREDRLGIDSSGNAMVVGLVGFDRSHRGGRLLMETLINYLTGWWGFATRSDSTDDCDILMIDESTALLAMLQSKQDFSRPIVILSSVRGDSNFMSALDSYERSGGFCRVLFKPGGPSRLRHVIGMCANMVKMRKVPSRHQSEHVSMSTTSSLEEIASSLTSSSTQVSAAQQPTLSRRRSDETQPHKLIRPSIGQRSSTYHHHAGSRSQQDPGFVSGSPSTPFTHSAPTSPGLTVTVGAGAMLLKSSINTLAASQGPRVLIVEDNELLRNLLGRWLASKGYDYMEANDGQEGVNVFNNSGPFNIILIDVSMPVLDGIGATAEIRRIEASRVAQNKSIRKDGHMIANVPPVRILALTGMSSLEDKRRAFEAGVDGYLVKPVAFKTLTALFHQLGIS